MPTKKVPPEQKARSRSKSNENLKNGNRFKSNDPVTKKAQIKGGKNSQIKRREERVFSQIMEMVWGSKPVMSPQVRDQLIRYGMDPDGDNITSAVVSAVSAAQKANKGDIRALQAILEILGQDPKTMLERERLNLEREALQQQGAKGYGALDDAFAALNGSEDQ